MARSYDQYCPVASALDRVGDRWTLLILRDLLWYGPARFGDFTAHNLGIPTALLAERLRALAEAGLVVREGHTYRAVDPGGELRSLVDGLASLGERFLVAEEPTRKSLDYLARRMSTIHHEALADRDEESMTITVGTLTVGCTIGAGSVAFDEPRGNDPHVRASPEQFMQLVAGTRPPRGLAIDGADPEGVIELLRFLSSAP